MLTLNYQYRIYPGAEQEATMLSWLETLRQSYNYALREVKDWSASRRCGIDRCELSRCYVMPADAPFPSEHIQQANLVEAKKRFPELKQVQSQVLQQNIKRLHKAFEGMRKQGRGYPRFKKYGRMRSFLFPQFRDNPIVGYQLKLPKLGLMPIVLHRPIPDGFVVKQVRVVAKARGTQWFVNVSIQSAADVPEHSPMGRSVGIDLGIEKFLTTSDGEQVLFPRFFRRLQAELRSLQRRAARKVRRSMNWEKAQVRVARLHAHIANVRRLFHWRTAHWLCDRADVIFYEDLNIKGLARGFLAKDCLDASWGGFVEVLKQVCWKRGKTCFAVDPRGTSQICPMCKGHTPKKLSDRWHKCQDPACGFEADRDHASAIEIDDRGNALITARGLRVVETA